MSKLEISAIVLCAAFFFVPESSTKSLTSLDRNAVGTHIKYAMEHIARRADKLREELYLIEMLPIEKDAGSIDEAKSKIETDIALAREFVDDIIENATSTFSETKCRSYFVDYEEAARDVASHFNISVISAINLTRTKVEEAIAVATAATRNLERLEILARRCSRNRWLDIIKTSESTLVDVLQQTNSVLCKHRTLINGSKTNKAFRLVSGYTDYVKKSNTLIENTLNCVNNINIIS